MVENLQYLQSLGIDENRLINYYNSYGGLALGLRIAARTGRQASIFHSPQSLVIPLPIRNLDQYSQELAFFSQTGFTIKYSGTRESFSPHAVRGANSSRTRYWSPSSQRSIFQAIRAIDYPSPLPSAIVIQEYIRDAYPAGVIHMHVRADRTTIEHRHPRGVFVYDLDRSGSSYCARIGEIGEVPATATGLNIAWLNELAEALRRQCEFAVDIELFQRTSGLCILQLRPIPTDVEFDAALDRKIHANLTSDRNKYERALLFNGVWRHDTAVFDDPYSQVTALPKENSDIRQCNHIVARLESRKPTLVIDLESGFRLSHGLEDLPELVTHRESFAYLSLATTTYRPKTGDIISYLSSGLTASYKLL